MKLFVTGSTGKVGTRAARYLADKGHDLKVLVRDRSSAREAQDRGWDVVEGDLSASTSLSSAMAGADAVIHLAAFFRGATPDQIKAINELATVQLARAALRANVSRFVYTSTSLVYGAGFDHAALETDAVFPQRPYPQSKLAAERGLAQLKESDGLDPRIVRLAFVYGGGDSHLTDWLPRLRELPGNRRLQLIHHLDVCQALELVLTAVNAKGFIYNVADDEPLQNDEILHLLTSASGKASETLSEQEKWEGIIDSTRIRKDLGFCPTFPSLRDAIAKHAL